MASDQLLPVKLGQLELGLPLRYNVFAEDGELLAPAGVKFTELLKSEWAERGISTINVQVAEVPNADSQSLLQPYDAEAIKRLESNLKLAKTAALTLATRLNDRQSVNSGEFQELASLLLKDIQGDSAIALLSLFKSQNQQLTENDLMVSLRCSQLSLLSMVIACELGWEEHDCQLAGMTGLLHDVSLIGLPADLSLDDQEEQFQQHSLKSAYMMEEILGIDPRICMAIAQVHESILGDGFPRGLPGNRLMPMARIVHLADAYITLTSNLQPLLFPEARNHHPADGLGYLMYHAARGRYETAMVKALVRCTSLYPIGSSVTLSDHTTAVVFRSTKVSPSYPVIQLEDQRLVDLRYSKLSILGPNRDADFQNRALRLSQMDQLIGT